MEEPERLDAGQVYDRLKKCMTGMAHRYAAPGHPLLDVEDLVQDQAVTLLEALEQRQDLTGTQQLQYIVRSCKNALNQAVRAAMRQGRCANVVSLDEPMDESEGDAIAVFLSDGSYERLRQRLETEERRSLLGAIECRVLKELESPGPQTLAAYEDEVDCLRNLQLQGKTVRVHDRLLPRHVARGLRLPVETVRQAFASIRTAYAA